MGTTPSATSGFKVDPNALLTFANSMSALATTVGKLASSYQLVPVDFGQGSTPPTNFTDAAALYQKYYNQYDSLVGGPANSLSQFASLLNTLADAASQIAKKYQDAQDADVVGVNEVDNLLSAINPSTTTLNP